MSDSDIYWSSDEENNNELIQDSRDLPPIEMDSEEEEEYNETLKLVRSKINLKNDSIFDLNIESKKDQPRKKEIKEIKENKKKL